MSPGTDLTHRACVEEFGFSWDEIVTCSNSDFAVQTLLEWERISAPVMAITDWVPTVAYNGEVNELSAIGAPPLRDILCTFVAGSTPACF